MVFSYKAGMDAADQITLRKVIGGLLLVGILVALLKMPYVKVKDFVQTSGIAASTERIEVHVPKENHSRWIVVTTINEPNSAIQQLASIEGWKMVVVGDKKTPKSWNVPGVVYLDVEAQNSLGYAVNSLIPYNTYTRKMIGYLYAIQNGAQLIYETDDDNFISNLQGFFTDSLKKGLVVSTSNVTFNPYPHFGQSTVWPRGYPLKYVGGIQPRSYCLRNTGIPAIQQGVVNGDPDVDAIFRMTRKQFDRKMDIHFDNNAPAVILPSGTFAPFNSQNTLFTKSAFWALFLPTTVTDRESDIYRSYWAQKLLWLTGKNLAFLSPATVQERNFHSFEQDAKMERRLYIDVSFYVDFLSKWRCSSIHVFTCMRRLANDLVMAGYIEKRDKDLMDAWIMDLVSVGYKPPFIRRNKKATGQQYQLQCQQMSLPLVHIVFYPAEQKTSLPNIGSIHLPPLIRNPDPYKVYSDVCEEPPALTQNVNTNFSDVLLIISITKDADVIPILESAYRFRFRNILYCVDYGLRGDIYGLTVTYVLVKQVEPFVCLYVAKEMHYNVNGYLYITQNMMITSTALNLNSLTIGSSMVYYQSLCSQNDISCVSVLKQSIITIQESLNTALERKGLKYHLNYCFSKIISMNTQFDHVMIPSDILLYISENNIKNFINLSKVILDKHQSTPYTYLGSILAPCAGPPPTYLTYAHLDNQTTLTKVDYLFPFPFYKIKNNKSFREAKISNGVSDTYCNIIDSLIS